MNGKKENCALFGHKPKYLFLDEIQNIPNWSKWVRRLLDTHQTRLILTGSSSKLSSQEIATELRGRSWETHLYPLKRLIQVCFEWEDRETREREIRSLIKAGKKFNCQQLQIVTKAEKKEVMPKVTLVPIERLVQPLTPTQKRLKYNQIADET